VPTGESRRQRCRLANYEELKDEEEEEEEEEEGDEEDDDADQYP